jgi:uncharacterized protein YjdB
MRYHAWSGVTAIVALSLVAAACGEKGTGSPSITSPTTASPLALSRTADTLAVDESLQLSAIVPLLPGSPPPITWTSSDENVAIVTRSGVLYAIKSGKTVVTVTSRGVSASTNVTVRPTIRDIKFASDTIGISLSDSVRLPYRVIDSDGQPIDLSQHKVVWSSTSPDVAPLTGNATVTGRSLGIASVSLSVDSKVGTTNVHVMQKPVATVSVSPASVAVLPGQQMQLTASTYDVKGNKLSGRTVTWTSSNTAIATVSASGMVTAVATGKADVTALADGKSAIVPVTVSAPATSAGSTAPVVSVDVTLNAPSIVAGQSTQANAVLKDASNNVLTGRTIAWSSSDINVATVNATGMVTGIKAGSATITAVSEGHAGTAALTATAAATSPASVASISLVLSAASAVVGSTAQVTATLKDSAGNVLTGRTVTWVSSDATVAGVAANGLITALKAGSVTITASSGGSTGSIMFTATAPTSPVHMITLTSNASAIKIGELTQVSGVVKDVSGNAIPGVTIFWSSSPTSVATISSSGMVTGRGAGSATIYAKADTVTRSMSIAVIDSATTTVTTSSPPPTTTTASSTTILAEQPRVTVNTTYPTMTRQVRIAAGADLQAALNAAQPGDELLLAPGATYVGNFVLPNKGASTKWIVVRTDVTDAMLGAAGTRMTPSRAASLRLARVFTSYNESAIVTAPGAHHWRLTGLELGGTSTAQEISGIVRLGTWDSWEPTVASMGHDFVIDRVYMHGTPTQAVRRCLFLSSGSTAVIDSWLSECHSNNGDSQGILALGGAGPYAIDNNEISGGHEVIMFGGGDPVVPNLVASDIMITRNHITRPPTDRGVWQVKNLLELKSAKRVLIQGNVMENNWADAQTGFGLLIKSVNQDGGCTQCGTQDVTIVGNVLKKSGSGINIAGDVQGPSLITSRITLVDNLIDSLNVGVFTADGVALQLLEQATDVSISHLTFTPMPTGGLNAISFDGVPEVRLSISGSIFPHNAYGIKGSGGSDGTNSLNTFAPGAYFVTNAIVGGTCSYYPTTTMCPSSWPASLSLAADGKPMGADLNRIATLTRGAVVAP